MHIFIVMFGKFSRTIVAYEIENEIMLYMQTSVTMPTSHKETGFNKTRIFDFISHKNL